MTMFAIFQYVNIDVLTETHIVEYDPVIQEYRVYTSGTSWDIHKNIHSFNYAKTYSLSNEHDMILELLCNIPPMYTDGKFYIQSSMEFKQYWSASMQINNETTDKLTFYLYNETREKVDTIVTEYLKKIKKFERFHHIL